MRWLFAVPPLDRGQLKVLAISRGRLGWRLPVVTYLCDIPISNPFISFPDHLVAGRVLVRGGEKETYEITMRRAWKIKSMTTRHAEENRLK